MPSSARAEAHGPAWPTDRAHRKGNWALIREAIAAHPDKIALTSIHQPWDLLPALGLRAPHATHSSVTPPPGSLSPCFKLSYAQLDAASLLVATHLHAQGIRPGSRVMVCLENRAEWALVWWATMRIGGVFVPINTQSIQRSEDLRHFLATSEAACVVVQSDTAAQVIDDLCPHTLACRMTVASSSGTAGWPTLHDVLATAADMAPCPEHFASPSDDAILLFTSGTTSLPKPVVLTNTQQAGAENWAERLPWLATDYDAINICHHMPPQHVFATLISFMAWWNGGAVVFPAPTFEPEKSLYAFAAEGCNLLASVPAMVSVLMAHPALSKYAPHMQIALAIVGGSNVSDALAARTKTQLHVRAVVVGYGLTEGAPITAWDVQRPEICKGIGTVMAESAVMIVDADTLEGLPRNEPGELLITGSLTIQRYGNGSSQETFVALPDMHGKTRTWMRTGDFASMDDDGVIHLQGRIKDIIIRGGENLSAARIEGAIEELAGVKVAQVVGTAHSTYGELPVAIVEYNPDCKEEERTIYRHVSQRLGPDSAPVRTFELSDLGLDAWPMTLSRKVQKRFLLTAVDAYFAAKHERTMEVQPGESTLDTVRRVWQNIVPMAASVHDDDGELAMLINSLDYMAFIGHIRRLLGKTVTMHGLQTNPSMVMQAALVDGAPKIMALGASEGSFRAQPGVDLEASQIIHLLPPTKFTLEHTRTLVAASLKHVDAGLTWADVESVVPMNSMARYLQTSRRPRSACHRQELHVKRPVAALQRALLLAIDSCEMMRCASAPLDDKWSVLIALRANAKTQPLLVQSASIATYSDIEQLQIDDDQDGVQPPGLHARFTVVEVQDEPGHSALLSWAQHSIFDFQSLRSFYTTLDRFLAAPETPLPSPVPSLGPFASWLYGREDSGAGAADVAYHVARLAGLSTIKNRWPPQRSPEWMRGCDNGWIDVATGRSGTGRVSLGGDTSKIEAGVVSKAMAIKLEHLNRFRAAHPTIFPAMMVKAALAAFNMAESGSGDVVFAQFENGRYATEDLPPDLDLRAVEGPVMEMLVNRVRADPKRTTALELMEQVQRDQLDMTEHAHANIEAVMAAMRRGDHGASADDAAVFDDSLRRQFFNWFSDFEVDEPQCIKRTRASGHGDLGVLWNIGPRKDDTLWLATPYDFCQLSPEEARRASRRFLSAAAWFSNPDNASRPIEVCDFDSQAVYDC